MNDLQDLKRFLADKYITDSVQKDIFLNEARLFKQWSNYIAGLVITLEGQKEFRPIDIKNELLSKVVYG